MLTPVKVCFWPFSDLTRSTNHKSLQRLLWDFLLRAEQERSRLLGRISHESNNENAPSDPRANLLPFIVLAPENSVVARWGYRIFRGCRTNEAIVSVYSHSRHADFIVALADHIWDAKWIFPVAWCLPCSQSEGWGQQDGERLGRRAPLSHADKCRQPWVAAAATAW